jgi:hypothetical protein
MLAFREIVVLDFEFTQADGERPHPLCLEAIELKSGKAHSLWRDELKKISRAGPPFDVGPDVLVVAYYASAEMSCFLALDWPRPKNILDLFAEDRAITNGVLPRTKGQHSLIGACTRRGIPVMLGADKAEARDLVIGRTSWSYAEVEHIQRYCRADVAATAKLLLAMERDGEIDWPYALLRGRYTMAVASMERAGVPLDVELLDQIRQNWDGTKRQLIRSIDADFGVYDDTTFKMDRFGAYLERNGISWPLTETGRLKLEDDTFRDMSRTYPQLSPLKELRSSLASMRLSDLQVGQDGRNRCMLSPFGSSTGRNTPSNTKFIFGPSVWMRSLIKPPEGCGLVYCDWRSQEVAVTAAVFGDERMMAAYNSGDVYLGFARDAGLAPATATARTHGPLRDLCKLFVLALSYGGGDAMLAGRLGIPVSEAARLKQLHRETYPDFWANSDRYVASAFSTRRASSVFGWPIRIRPDDRPQSVLNFPVQSSAADMMRIACIAATEAGLEVAAPIHDAMLLVSPIERVAEEVQQLRHIMEAAGTAVTGGTPVSADAKVVLCPDRYADKRGEKMWDTVVSLLPRDRSLKFTYGAQRAQPSPTHI